MSNSPEYMREWRKNHPENIKRYKQKYSLKLGDQNKEYYESHKEAVKQYMRDYRNNNKEKLRKRKLERTYGIDLDYEKLFQDQNGCCAICGRSYTEFQRPLCVDHDHDTGEVRGLLCSPCNVAIGLLRSNTDVLLQAIRYLKSKPKGK